MGNFDKRMALDVIEDAFADLGTPHGCGVATGLCGAFYMCGLISAAEWETLIKRIPSEHHAIDDDEMCEIAAPGTKTRGRMLN